LRARHLLAERVPRARAEMPDVHAVDRRLVLPRRVPDCLRRRGRARHRAGAGAREGAVPRARLLPRCAHAAGGAMIRLSLVVLLLTAARAFAWESVCYDAQ